MIKVSILVPFYNEEASLPLLYLELKKLMDNEKDYEWEVLFVNDGSKDNTINIMSGGYDCNYIKVILPYIKKDLLEQSLKFNINGIYHNKNEKFCIIKGNNYSTSCNIINYSEPSFLGSLRNYIFKNDKINTKQISLTDYFYYKGQTYYIIYDFYIEVYNYTYAN